MFLALLADALAMARVGYSTQNSSRVPTIVPHKPGIRRNVSATVARLVMRKGKHFGDDSFTEAADCCNIKSV